MQFIFYILFLIILETNCFMKKQTQIFGSHFYTHLTELYNELEKIPVQSEINKNSNLYNGLYKKLTEGRMHTFFDIFNSPNMLPVFTRTGNKCHTKLNKDDLFSFVSEKKIKLQNVYTEKTSHRMEKIYEGSCFVELCAFRKNNIYYLFHLNSIYECD